MKNGGVSAGAFQFFAIWLARETAPTGLCPPAQGCEERATLGTRANTRSNPNGVVAVWRFEWPQPRWGWEFCYAPTQGSPLGAGNPELEAAAPLGLRVPLAQGKKLRITISGMSPTWLRVSVAQGKKPSCVPRDVTRRMRGISIHFRSESVFIRVHPWLHFGRWNHFVTMPAMAAVR